MPEPTDVTSAMAVVPGSQLDRIEGTLNRLWARVDILERRASFWGATSAVLVTLATKFMGCA